MPKLDLLEEGLQGGNLGSQRVLLSLILCSQVLRISELLLQHAPLLLHPFAPYCLDIALVYGGLQLLRICATKESEQRTTYMVVDHPSCANASSRDRTLLR